jgi:DoxX-like family
MNLERNKMQMEDLSISKRRRAWGTALINFCAIGLILSSIFKFSQLPGPIAYMASLGYEDGAYFLIAGVELLVGVAFWLRSTRPLGLLLVSSYFGGAISAHLASGHPSLARGPYMAYMLSHPLAGVIPACVFLGSAWIGTWLVYPNLLNSLRERTGSAATSQQARETAMLSRS